MSYTCSRCGDDVLALHKGLCSLCFSIEPLTGLEKQRLEVLSNRKERKPKGKHLIESNIRTYMIYVIEHPELEKLNKREFETLMDIPFTSVNYLVKVLKQRGLIATKGIIGRQHYVPDRTFINTILHNLQLFRKLTSSYNEKSIRQKKPISCSLKEEKEQT